MDEIGLVEKDYSQSPREQKRYLGEEKAAIRLLDPDDLKDMSRLLGTMGDERVKKWVEDIEDLTIQDVRNWVRRAQEDKRVGNTGEWEVVFGVSGSPANPELPAGEVGEYQGFINCYSDLETRNKVRGLGGQLGKKMTRETDIVELSVAKRPDSPKGQMVSGIRQVCIEINRLKSKGVNKTRGKYSKFVEPDMVVVAFIEPDNLASRKVFVQAGFEDRGLCYYEDEDKVKPLAEVGVHAYVLNWEKLNEFMHQEADAELLGKLGRKVI